MASSRSARTKLIGFLMLLTFMAPRASAQTFPPTQSKPFADEYAVTWSPEKVIQSENGSVALTMDQQGGSGYGSTSMYTFGYVSTAIKLVAGNSAGTVTAYYLSSNASESDHDELDFEFLGNTSGQPYILQTNVFANGVGEREQRTYLWFDPSADYHTYSVLWNKEIIIFAVDETPIRIFKNNVNLGVDYPQSKPMGIYSSLWNGESWATRGGLDKIDWSLAPFAASYKNFTIDACEASTGQNSSCTLSDKWWAQTEYQTLNGSLQNQLKTVKKDYMIYDYCTDTSRYPVAPAECATN